MPEYQVHYEVTLYGSYYLDANSEKEVLEDFDDLSVAELVSGADHCSADRQIGEIETEAHPLEQLADAADDAPI